jgi:flagellar motor switch protein FliN/FliY
MAEETPSAAPQGGEPTAAQPAPVAPSTSTEPAVSPQAAAPPDANTASAPTASTAPAADGNEPASLDSLDQFSIEELLKQANFEDPAASGGAPSGSSGAEAARAAPDAQAFKFPGFQQAIQDAQASSIDLLRDVELNVKIELGRSRMLVEDVLKLSEGSVVELDKLAGDPVDVFVNDRLVARGEVLVLNDNFCVRVNEIVPGVKDEGL